MPSYSLLAHVLSLSTSFLLLLATVQRYFRLQTEYDHYERREQMLQIITQQKRDELEHVMNHIHQLLLFEENTMETDRSDPTIARIDPSECVYDHGDHRAMVSLERYRSSLTDDDDDDESENDPLLQRLKFTRPSRLKTSTPHVYKHGEYLSE